MMYIFMPMKETGVYPSPFRTFRSEKYADVYDKAQGNALFYRSRGILMDHIQMMTKYIHAND